MGVFFCGFADLLQHALHVLEAHVVDALQVLRLGVHLLELPHFLAALRLELVDLAEHRRRILQLERHVRRLADARGDLRHLAAQPARGRAHVVAGERGPRRLKQAHGELGRCEIRHDLVDDRILEVGQAHRSLGRAWPAIPVALRPPLLSVGVVDQAREQRLGLAVALDAIGPRARLRLEARQQRLGLRVADEGLVRVARDDPLRPRASLLAANVGAAAALRVHVPDRVAGVRERVPLDRDQGGVADARDAGDLDRAAARHAGSAFAQVGRDARRDVRIHLEHRLGDRLPFAHRARGDLLEAVAGGRAAARAKAGAHVLGHAGEALLLAEDRVVLVPCNQDRLEQHLGERVDVRQCLVDDAHAVLLAVDLLEDQRDYAPARKPRGVVEQHRAPAALRIPHRAHQALEAGAVLVLATLDGVHELLDDGQAALLSELQQRPALRVRRDVLAVLARAQVERCVVLHARASVGRR
ncbi:MAG TPA: hypothetical protein VIG88_14025 [Lysobacter sp.]